MTKFTSPPATKFGPSPAQRQQAPAARPAHAPPPTRFGTPPIVQPKPAHNQPAPGPKPIQAKMLERPGQTPPQPRRQPGGQVVQPFSAVSNAVGRMWNRFLGFDGLDTAMSEAFAEGLESIDHFLYSRDGFALNSHRGEQFQSEWQRFQNAPGAGAGIFCHQDNPAGFRQRVLSGEGFIWALTEEERLVVGTSSGVVNHSILARGSAVIGAGEGTLRHTPQERLWLEWKHEERLQSMGAYDGFGDEMKERYNELRDMNLTQPPQRQSGTVVLDFGSGHYRPKSGWRRVLTAWQNAGFFAVVDETSRFK